MPTSFGYARVDEGRKQALVDEVFHKVAERYDLMNDLMSGGLHRVWKDAMVSYLAPPRAMGSGWRLLDVAGGTGDIATRVVRRSNEMARAVVCDINESMLNVGRDRAEKAGLGDVITFTQGNAEDLPFPDRSFDAYTIAFGIRNVPDIPKALREARRVLKRGGRFLCLEFSEVDVPVLDKLYDTFSFQAIPVVGKWVTGDGDPYQYLVESIRRFPNQERFADMIREAGFERVTYRNYSGGIAALHSGWKL
ncbi:bifunctional demethylmenaquinone methyltransferase/2-methoxy-6-polyprenyl-1,4-benzoquinol methylase UbiE [Roseibium sp. DSM 29163]|uniref:Ubiquinone/menaquinone biosynthesis C-methyltransferase UbiE n=2 Tax=Roseibium salinum TaxID=1604349 RepID=A0ABT3R5M8_9HYPH|nr:bifunctional demethylmenaquinone methyltransferase/2-methoxy-6-polyprenyl-1,4-benzoquinol methylase UbiE [Roseibium sp. DSM 29163]MCX2724489.1 bifunctional demethylmenaquinone methyltransferase/2-methoxy-6-polyprenyl-1,4-benzoquinol methylase UbiE [Roseibium sp. DSM 29163]